MIRILYILMASTGLALFAAHGFMGYDPFSSSTKMTIPADARKSPGGYRTHIFWYSGYHGGK